MTNLKIIYPLQLLEWVKKLILEIQKVNKQKTKKNSKLQKKKWWII